MSLRQRESGGWRFFLINLWCEEARTRLRSIFREKLHFSTVATQKKPEPESTQFASVLAQSKFINLPPNIKRNSYESALLFFNIYPKVCFSIFLILPQFPTLIVLQCPSLAKARKQFCFDIELLLSRPFLRQMTCNRCNQCLCKSDGDLVRAKSFT